MTYKEIQDQYKKQHKSTVKTCWIADVKRKNGFKVRPAYNRGDDWPKYPCPPEIFKELSKIIGKPKKEKITADT